MKNKKEKINKNNIFTEKIYEKESNFDIDKNIINIKEDFNNININIIKKSIHKLTYGMYIITTKKDNIINGQTANTVFQLTSDPVQIAICLNNNNYTNELIKESKKVAIHIMGLNSLNILSEFGFKSGRNTNKFLNFNYKIEKNLPLMKEYCLSLILGYINYFFNIGTHTLFIIKPFDGFINENKKDEKIMTYNDFRILKKRENFVINENKKDEKINKFKYVCSVCGYVYNEKIEIILFNELSEKYLCPICSAKKNKFEIKI